MDCGGVALVLLKHAQMAAVTMAKKMSRYVIQFGIACRRVHCQKVCIAQDDGKKRCGSADNLLSSHLFGWLDVRCSNNSVQKMCKIDDLIAQ